MKKIALILFTVTLVFLSATAVAEPITDVCQRDPTKCTNSTDGAVDPNNPIVIDIQLVVDFLSVGVGIIVVGVIILGGIQYTIAGDNPQAVTAAKQRIINGLIALVAFIFTFAFLQWVVPGGIF